MKPTAARARPTRQRFKDSTAQRFNVSLANRQTTRNVDLRLLRRIVRSLLSEFLQIEQSDVGICLLDAPRMTRLNETFLRHAGATDVITFDYARQPAPDPSQEGNKTSRVGLGSPLGRGPGWVLHGEIFVCVDEAVLQARRFRTTWQSELVRYIVHGVLHLRGFDDRRPAARRRMKGEENRLLGSLAKRFHFSDLARHRASTRVNRKS